MRSFEFRKEARLHLLLLKSEWHGPSKLLLSDWFLKSRWRTVRQRLLVAEFATLASLAIIGVLLAEPSHVGASGRRGFRAVALEKGRSSLSLCVSARRGPLYYKRRYCVGGFCSKSAAVKDRYNFHLWLCLSWKPQQWFENCAGENDFSVAEDRPCCTLPSALFRLWFGPTFRALPGSGRSSAGFQPRDSQGLQDKDQIMASRQDQWPRSTS